LALVLGLVDEDEVTMSQAVTALTGGPAAALGIDRGTLSVGAVADVCLFDPDEQWVLNDASMLSRGHNTPFKGRTLKGRVRCTLMGGRVVFESPPA
jgi:dihydroorotase